MPFLNRVLLAALCVALFGCSKDQAAGDKPPAAETTPVAQRSATPRNPVPKQHPVIKAEATPAKNLDRPTILALAEPSTSPTVHVHGRVTLADGDTSSPAVVSILQPRLVDPTRYREVELAQTTASLSGEFELSAVEGGRMVVRASAANHADATFQVPMPAVDARNGSRDVQQDFVLSPSAVLEGQLVDAITSAPVSGVPVFATNILSLKMRGMYATGETTSDLEGRFRIATLPAGGVVLSATPQDYVHVTHQVDAPTTALTIVLDPAGASLSGHVTRKGTGEAITSAVAVLTPVQRPGAIEILRPVMVASGTDGTFEFKHLLPTTYTLSVRKGSLRTVPGPSTLPIPLTQNKARTGFDVQLYDGYTLQATVVNEVSHEPLSGVEIQCRDEGDAHHARTDDNGSVTLANVFADAGGNVVLTMTKPGFRPASHDSATAFQSQVWFSVRGDEDTTLTREFFMAPLLTVSGRAKLADGTSVPQALVTVYYPLDPGVTPEAPQPVQADGSFELGVTENSTVRVKATGPGFSPSYSEAVKITDKSTSGVDVIMELAATISGIVVDEANAPVANANVKLYRFRVPGSPATRENFGPVQSGPDGTFTLPDLPSKEVHIFASKTGYASSLSQLLNLTPGETKTGVRLVLRKGNHIGGRVTDSDTGTPIAHARVNMYAIGPEETSNANTETDENGVYKVDEIANGRLRVSVRAEGYDPADQDNVSPGRDDVNFALTKRGSYSLIGHVIDSKTRAPVRDFEAVVNPGRVERTGIPGDFKAQLEPGMATVIINSKGYQPLTERVRISKDQKKTEQTFVLGGGGTIIGRTVAPTTLVPVSGVHILLRTADQWGNISEGTPDADTITGADGRFKLDGGKPGLAAVVFMQADPPVEINRKINVAHDQVSDMGDIEMSNDGPKIVAHVVNTLPTGDAPVAGVKVRVREVHESQPQDGVTDANGLYEFPSLKTGYYVVSATDYGNYAEVSLVAQETRDVVLHIGQGQLLGHIVCGGQPVVASVQLRREEESGRRLTSDSTGTFKAENLVPGKYRVQINAPQTGNVVREESVDVGAEGITEHTFTLPVSRLTGHVVTAADQPVAGATVSVSYTRASDTSYLFASTLKATTSADGSFEITGLPPGTYTASATKQGSGNGVLNNVEVPADGGEPQPVSIRLAADGGTLVSVALDMTTGAPVPPAWCYLFSESGRYDHGVTRGTDGVMTITGIPAGKYRVEVSSFGYSVVSHQVEIVAGETQRLEDVLYESGAVRLTVVDNTRRTVANATCHLQPDAQGSTETPRDVTADSSGLCIIRGLMPGMYTATVKGPAGNTATAPVIITAHEVTIQNVTLP